jgi:hypothetical protein
VTADEFAATVRTTGDAAAVDEAGTGSASPVPAGPRRCTLDEIEYALDAVIDFARHDRSSVVKQDAQFLEGMVPVIIDALFAAHHYRTRGHLEVDGEPGYLQLTSWVDITAATAADNVVRWVTP